MKHTCNLSNRIHNINEFKPYTNMSTRLQFVNGFVKGKMHYMLPIFINTNREIKTKLHRVMMHVVRIVIGNYCCR